MQSRKTRIRSPGFRVPSLNKPSNLHALRMQLLVSPLVPPFQVWALLPFRRSFSLSLSLEDVDLLDLASKPLRNLVALFLGLDPRVARSRALRTRRFRKGARSREREIAVTGKADFAPFGSVGIRPGTKPSRRAALPEAERPCAYRPKDKGKVSGEDQNDIFICCFHLQKKNESRKGSRAARTRNDKISARSCTEARGHIQSHDYRRVSASLLEKKRVDTLGKPRGSTPKPVCCHFTKAQDCGV